MKTKKTKEEKAISAVVILFFTFVSISIIWGINRFNNCFRSCLTIGDVIFILLSIFIIILIISIIYVMSDAFSCSLVGELNQKELDRLEDTINKRQLKLDELNNELEEKKAKLDSIYITKMK